MKTAPNEHRQSIFMLDLVRSRAGRALTCSHAHTTGAATAPCKRCYSTLFLVEAHDWLTRISTCRLAYPCVDNWTRQCSLTLTTLLSVPSFTTQGTLLSKQNRACLEGCGLASNTSLLCLSASLVDLPIPFSAPSAASDLSRCSTILFSVVKSQKCAKSACLVDLSGSTWSMPSFCTLPSS